jgi:hypothetical protein
VPGQNGDGPSAGAIRALNASCSATLPSSGCRAQRADRPSIKTRIGVATTRTVIRPVDALAGGTAATTVSTDAFGKMLDRSQRLCSRNPTDYPQITHFTPQTNSIAHAMPIATNTITVVLRYSAIANSSGRISEFIRSEYEPNRHFPLPRDFHGYIDVIYFPRYKC